MYLVFNLVTIVTRQQFLPSITQMPPTSTSPTLKVHSTIEPQFLQFNRLQVTIDSVLRVVLSTYCPFKGPSTHLWRSPCHLVIPPIVPPTILLLLLRPPTMMAHIPLINSSDRVPRFDHSLLPPLPCRRRTMTGARSFSYFFAPPNATPPSLDCPFEHIFHLWHNRSTVPS